MSDGTRVNIYYSAESVYGTTNATPAWTQFRVKDGVSLNLSKEIISMDSIRSDGEITDERHGTRQGAGEIPVNFAYGEYDPFLEAATGGTWAAKATLTGITYSVDATDNSFNDSGNGFVTAGFEVGDTVTSSGFTTGANNGDFVITAVAAGKLTCAGTDGDALVTEVAGDTVTIAAQDQLLIGTTRRSFSIMLHFTDQSGGDNPYHIHTGVEFSGYSLTFAINSAVALSFPVVFRDVSYAATAPAGSTYVAASSNKPFGAIAATINEGGSSLATVTEFAPALERPLDPLFSIGSAVTTLPSVGTSSSSGNASVYFDNSALMEKFLNETESSFDITVTDPDGNSFKHDWPRTKVNGAEISISPGALIQSIPLKALLGASEPSSVIMTRNPA